MGVIMKEKWELQIYKNNDEIQGILHFANKTKLDNWIKNKVKVAQTRYINDEHICKIFMK